MNQIICGHIAKMKEEKGLTINDHHKGTKTMTPDHWLLDDNLLVDQLYKTAKYENQQAIMEYCNDHNEDKRDARCSRAELMEHSADRLKQLLQRNSE